MIMILHQFPSVYIHQPLTPAHVGRTTSNMGIGLRCSAELERGGGVVEFIEVMHKSRVILRVKKYLSPINSSVKHMI